MIALRIASSEKFEKIWESVKYYGKVDFKIIFKDN